MDDRMQIEDFKTWQWMLIGLLAGGLFSSIRMWQGPAFANSSVDTIDVGEFEHQAYAGTRFGGGNGPGTRLINQYHKDLPLLKNVIVHPPLSDDPHHRYWITGREYSVATRLDDPTRIGSAQHLVEQWKGFKYESATPYLPGYALKKQLSGEKEGLNFFAQIQNRQLGELKKSLGDKESFPTVMDYLRAVRAMPGAKLECAFAWYELPIAVWTMPPLAGLLLIGVAWPLTLGLMQNFGMARPPLAVRMPKARVAPTPRPVMPIPSNAGVVFQPIVVAQASEEIEHKEYGGEFYPVVRSTHKE